RLPKQRYSNQPSLRQFLGQQTLDPCTGLLDFGQVGNGSDGQTNDLDHVGEVDSSHPVIHRVIVGVEPIIRELFAEAHGLVAVVQKAGMVAAVVDRMVV